jgi:IclR family acetate operon transcriptional repressor
VEHDSDGGNTATPTATVSRVTAVLDAFLTVDGELGVTELAAQLGLAKSVVHRLVTALADADYLSHNPATRRYSLGTKAVRLGLVAVGQLNIRARALAFLRELAAETGETATLSLLVGDQRVYAEQVESVQRVRQSVQIGATAPLFVGASGKAMLAFLPAARRLAIVSAAVEARARHADGRAIQSESLARELDQVRRRGYATSHNERELGAASAAAPVFDHHGEVVASMSVAGVTVRHGPDDLARFGELVKRYAERLSASLGSTGRAVALAATD